MKPSAIACSVLLPRQTLHLHKMSKAFYQWTTVVLAALAGVDPTTISRLESSGRKPVKGYAATVDAVSEALRKHGVEYDEGGVYLVKKAGRK
jgi:hypothetical protein